VNTTVENTPVSNTPAQGSEDPGPQAPLARTLALARPVAGRLVLATLLGAGSLAAAIGLIATSAWLISRSEQRPQESAVAIAIVGVQFFALARGLSRYGERLVGHDAAFRVLAQIRVALYTQLERLAPLGVPVFRSGDLLARLVHDVDELQDLLLRVVPPFAIAIGVGAATVAVVWAMLPAAALILLAALLIAATLVPWLTGRLATRGEARQAAARAELTACVVDLVGGAEELIVCGAVEEQLRRAREADAQLTRIAALGARTAGIGQGLTSLCTGLAMWGSLLVGVVAVHEGKLNGVLLAGLALIPLVSFELVTTLPAATQTLQRVRRSAARVFEAMDASVPVREPAEPHALPAPPYAVRMRDVSFGYPGCTRDAAVVVGEGDAAAVVGDSSSPSAGWSRSAGADVRPVWEESSEYDAGSCVRRALDGIDLDLSPGRRVAVVGRSGAGKSTLAGVLLRFLPYDAGSATLDGVELGDLDGDAYRTVVGLVSQDAHIFDSTLEENLRLARREASIEELRAALAQVRLLDWADGLPRGLSTEVGERGARMSGGQRRRVAIARALLADFPVLVLDEPGEHLDTHTADAIVGELLALTREAAASRGTSTLVITHRLAGLEEVDEVVVLDRGRVVERGSHEELLARDQRYASLWRRENEVSGLR
jgi:ABC-type transport system involved in cytochrome bd biosynthesis fused ATPase/permease subunit